jgi:hypothetical protein
MHIFILITNIYCSPFFRILDHQYLHYFYTESDLLNVISFNKIEGFDILKQFLSSYSFFKLGGDLLPDLIQFYQWLHHDLSNLITKEEAYQKSIHKIVDEFSSRYSDQSAMALYIRVRGRCIVL